MSGVGEINDRDHDRRSVGLLTIGQSPRADLVPEMTRWLGPVRVLERGALDGMGPGEISDIGPTTGDYPLVTRLRDGSSATIAKNRLLHRVRAAITGLEEEGAEAVLLLCTGEFPAFEHRRPLLTAEQLFVNGVRGIALGARVGILCPLPEQERLTREKWSFLGDDPPVASGFPYGHLEELRAPARKMRRAGVEYVVLDCMGYTQEMKELVRRESGAPVILARSVVARMTAEVL